MTGKILRYGPIAVPSLRVGFDILPVWIINPTGLLPVSLFQPARSRVQSQGSVFNPATRFSEGVKGRDEILMDIG
jgi:hypothetical protein